MSNTWICDLCNPKTFYSNVTAHAIFNHLCERSGGLHALDMVLLTIQMSQYYEGMPDISKYIFLLEDAQRKAARACLPVTNQTLTVLAYTALLAADTFLCITKLWEELDPADKTWAAWKTAYLAAHKKRAHHLCATGGADYLCQPTQPMPPPSTLASSTQSTTPLTTLPALPPMRRPSLSNLSPLTPLVPPPTPP